MVAPQKRREPGGTHLDRKTSLRDSLITSVLGADYATPRPPKKNRNKGPAPANAPRRSSAAVKGSDEMILEVRRLREQENMGVAAIAKHMTELGHPMDLHRARGICEYTTRSHLIPAANAAPYITKAAP